LIIIIIINFFKQMLIIFTNELTLFKDQP